VAHLVSVVFGTRPEAIKLAPVVLALKADSRFDCQVCVTGQHREMLDQVLKVFGIVPDADLGLMRPDQTLAGLTARAVEGLDAYLAKEKPDLLLVQGDTATAFCASLAGFYNHIPIGHVEAGLRTGNMDAPWPEEGFRVLVSRLATLHFAPTEESRQNLIREGTREERIHVTGNTVIDALFLALARMKDALVEVPGLDSRLLADPATPELVLITGHRRESFGAGFERICLAIAELASEFPSARFVYPVHLNPNVREPVNRILRPGVTGNVHLIEPLPYMPFVWLMNRSSVILTDSGGIQEEAPSLGKPVVVMRETTERPEAVAAGSCILVGTDRKKIVDSVAGILRDATSRLRFKKVQNPYGDGHAAPRVVIACARFLGI